MEVRFSRSFSKQYEKGPSKIKSSFEKRLKLFLNNPLHPQLNNHLLTGQLAGCRSINITGDWRAIYSQINERGNPVVIFEVLGTHNQLYK